MNQLKANKYSAIFLSYLFILIFGQLLSRSVDIKALDYIDEAIILALPTLFLSNQNRSLIICYLILCIGAAFNSGSDLLQFGIDLKFVSCIAAILLIRDKLRTNTVSSILAFLVTLNTLFIAIELSLPDLYQSIFKGDYGATFEFFGLHLYRANGIFFHPGEQALFSIIAFIWFMSPGRHEKYKKIAQAACLTTLTLSFQRAEITAFIIAISFYSASTHLNSTKRSNKINNKLTYALLAALLSAFIYATFFINLELDTSLSARDALYKGAFQILHDNPIFGIGPGKYGSHYSYGGQIYETLNFGQFWWYNQNRYLTDSFWPKILAEYGVAGFIAWSILIINSYKIAPTRICFTIFLILLMTSLQAPIYFNVKLILLSLIVCYTSEKDTHHCSPRALTLNSKKALILPRNFIKN